MKKFIDVIPNIAEGFDVSKGDIVLLHFWGENNELDVLDRFAIEIAKKGAFPLKMQQSREFIKNYYTEVDGEHLGLPDEYFETFKAANVVIDICMYTPPTPHKDFPREKINYYRENMMKIFRNVTEGKKYFIQVKVPTAENAAMIGVDSEVFEKSMINAAMVDYKELKRMCSEEVEKFEGKSNVEMFFGNEKFSFSIEGREWHKDDGNGDVPAGEIYIAPIEESGQGTVTIPKLIFNGVTYENVKLTFKDGVLIESSLKELIDEIKSCPGDGDKLAEFGIGLNENITELIGYSAYDEKIKGTVHIAVGMNDMFGGKNSAPMHMDFILKPDRILVDGEEYKI